MSQTFDLGLFRYSTEYKSLSAECSALGLRHFPDCVTIKRKKDGKQVTFYRDKEAYVRNEGWDGELMVYKPQDISNTGIHSLTLTHYAILYSSV